MANQTTTQIDFNDPRLAAAIENWDLVDFLIKNQVDYSLHGKNIGRDYIGVNPCPSCGDNGYHFAIHKNRKQGTCWKCKVPANPLKIISHFGHMSFAKAFDYLITYYEEDQDLITKVRVGLYGKPDTGNTVIIKRDALPENKAITQRDIANNKILRDFLEKRKLTFYHVQRYDIRISVDYPRKGFLIFPVSYMGHIVSYQMRSLIKKYYYNPENLSNYLFGEDRIVNGKPLLLVEGFLDYTNTDCFADCYYPEIKVTSGGLKSISDIQIRRLKQHRPSSLIVMFDNDSWMDYYRLKKQIPYDVNYVILPRGKDPNNLNEEELHDLFKKEIMSYV